MHIRGSRWPADILLLGLSVNTLRTGLDYFQMS
jgi:hypothetical protein